MCIKFLHSFVCRFPFLVLLLLIFFVSKSYNLFLSILVLLYCKRQMDLSISLSFFFPFCLFDNCIGEFFPWLCCILLRFYRQSFPPLHLPFKTILFRFQVQVFGIYSTLTLTFIDHRWRSKEERTTNPNENLLD